MTTQITAAMVKELREKTGAGMMDVKNALTETGGDMEKAAELLRQKGIASAEKKSGRAAAEGMILSKVTPDGKKGVLVEINCETDFVARGEEFQGMANALLDQALNSKASDITALLQEKSAEDPANTVEDYIKGKIGVIKENLGFRRFTRYELSGSGWVHSYIHMGNKIGVLVELGTDSDAVVQKEEFKQLAKDLALHIASTAPEFTRREDVPASVIEEEKRIEMGKEDLQSKPLEIREKIVMGRLDKLIAQKVFLEQPFVKDPAKTVQDLIQEQSKTLGATITVKQFVRYLLGEGVEKRQDNFAEEVMAQVKG